MNDGFHGYRVMGAAKPIHRDHERERSGPPIVGYVVGSLVAIIIFLGALIAIAIMVDGATP